MKLKILLLFSVAVLALGKLHAQEKLKFTSTNLAGIVMGSSEPAFQVQTINGVRYKDFSAGIGVGMDNYYYKSIPVFLHLTQKFSIKDFSPFVYADIGLNFPEDRTGEEEFWEASKYSKGLYFDLGIGYSIPLYKKMSMSFSLGYSQKHMDEKRAQGYFIGFPNGIYHELPSEYYSYTFRRISLKAGLSF
ncbi:MAG: hypothetical protein ACXWCZ_05995 [Flavisolibacter sp.]